jgi:HSP20 family protein
MQTVKNGPEVAKARTKEQAPSTSAAKALPAERPREAGTLSRPTSPFTFMRRFAEEMDRLFDDFGLGMQIPSPLGRARELFRRETGLVQADWSPKIDILEREGKFVVRADLPGLSKNDVKVELSADVLSIQGERRQERREEREGYSYNECSYGRFSRIIPLPEGADTSKASAHFHNGVLEVEMPAPTSQKPQARRLEIRERA